MRVEKVMQPLPRNNLSKRDDKRPSKSFERTDRQGRRYQSNTLSVNLQLNLKVRLSPSELWPFHHDKLQTDQSNE